LLVVVRLALWRRRPLSRPERLLLLVYGYNVFVAALFFTRIRFRLPFDVALLMLAILAIEPVVDAFRRRTERART
jgi:hypothetical protein